VAVQFVVQIQNRPGGLANLARALGARGVNIEHIGGGAAGPIGWVTLTTSDDASTREILRSTGLPFVEGEAIVVELEDRPGALAEVSERLATAGIGVLGLLRVGERNGKVEMALTVDDPSTARTVLGLH
jgi:hypothetical protein